MSWMLGTRRCERTALIFEMLVILEGKSFHLLTWQHPGEARSRWCGPLLVLSLNWDTVPLRTCPPYNPANTYHLLNSPAPGATAA